MRFTIHSIHHIVKYNQTLLSRSLYFVAHSQSEKLKPLNNHMIRSSIISKERHTHTHTHIRKPQNFRNSDQRNWEISTAEINRRKCAEVNPI